MFRLKKYRIRSPKLFVLDLFLKKNKDSLKKYVFDKKKNSNININMLRLSSLKRLYRQSGTRFNFQKNLKYYTRLRESLLLTLKLRCNLNSWSIFWYNYYSRLRFIRERCYVSKISFRRFVRKCFFDKFHRKWRYRHWRKTRYLRTLFKWRSLSRFLGKTRFKFFWMDFSRLYQVKLLGISHFSNLNSIFSKKLIWLSGLHVFYITKPHFLSTTLYLQNLYLFFKLKLRYVYNFYCFLPFSYVDFSMLNNKIVCNLKFLKLLPFFFNFDNLSFFFLYFFKKAYLRFQTYNRFFFYLYFFMRKSIFDTEPFKFFLKRNLRHSFYRGIFKQKFFFFFSKTRRFRFLRYQYLHLNLEYSFFKNKMVSKDFYVFFNKFNFKNLNLELFTYNLNMFKLHSVLIKKKTFLYFNHILWYKGYSGLIFENPTFFRKALSFWLSIASLEELKNLYSNDGVKFTYVKTVVNKKARPAFYGRHFYGLFLKKPRVPSFFFINKNFNAGFILTSPDLDKNYYYYKFNSNFLYGSLKFFKY